MSQQFKSPTYFTDTHEEILKLLGPDLCKKLDEINCSQPVNLYPVIKYIQIQDIFHCIDDLGYTFQQTADELKLSYTIVRNAYINHKVKSVSFEPA